MLLPRSQSSTYYIVRARMSIVYRVVFRTSAQCTFFDRFSGLFGIIQTYVSGSEFSYGYVYVSNDSFFVFVFPGFLLFDHLNNVVRRILNGQRFGGRRCENLCCFHTSCAERRKRNKKLTEFPNNRRQNFDRGPLKKNHPVRVERAAAVLHCLNNIILYYYDRTSARHR